MEASSVFAWNFYQTYAKGFVRDFGLMPDLVRRLEYSGPEEAVFVAKLDAVHDMMREIALKKHREAGGGGIA